MNNTINQYAIGELLDGRYFYIPSYQRGYRWTSAQVGDLLHDLLCFANDPKEKGDFYCLQPIIARPITDRDAIRAALGAEATEETVDDAVNRGMWEIIDGQQRLTTLFLIYKYLVTHKGWDEQTLLDEEDKMLYHIHYQTRPDSTTYLESMGMADAPDPDSQNIDFYYMHKAFDEIGKWIANEGKNINLRYKKGPSLSKVRDSLFSLLNGTRDTDDGSVQVLWYELEENSKSSIREFQKINTGIIRLTDAELIKGLFLMRRNFDGISKQIKQSELALEWEMIENTLHDDKFWYFLQKKGSDRANRIDLIFSLLYKVNQLKGVHENQWGPMLAEIDSDLNDPRKSVIFRFYNDKFEGKSGDELQAAVYEAWDEVMTLFRTLDDWFNTPVIYNLIGLLSQCGEDISKLVMYFDSMDETDTRGDFRDYLTDRVRHYLEGIKSDSATRRIDLSYGRKADRVKIYHLLLTLNVHLLNVQNDMSETECDLYKFPFDILSSQDWNIEHIDSFHTNALRSEKDKREWISVAMDDLRDQLSEEDMGSISSKMSERAFDSVISLLKDVAKETEADEDTKNSMGNFTLLDATTNKSYGNSLFRTKRRIILDNVRNGKFVMITTHYVFAKLFDESGTNRSYWTVDDMNKYHEYIYDNIKGYLK